MTIRPASVNFNLYQGATFDETVTVKDANDALVDLTGYTADLQVRRSVEDADPLFELTTANGGVVLGGLSGTIELIKSAAATAALDIDLDGEQWVYDIKLINGAYVERTIQGAIFAFAAVTR
jgi:hypothetical protein